VFGGRIIGVMGVFRVIGIIMLVIFYLCILVQNVRLRRRVRDLEAVVRGWGWGMGGGSGVIWRDGVARVQPGSSQCFDVRFDKSGRYQEVVRYDSH